jgi:hypothetical protein
MYFLFHNTDDLTSSFTFSYSTSRVSIISIIFGASTSCLSTSIHPSDMSMKWNLCSLLKPLTIPNATFCRTLYGFMSHSHFSSRELYITRRKSHTYFFQSFLCWTLVAFESYPCFRSFNTLDVRCCYHLCPRLASPSISTLPHSNC